MVSRSPTSGPDRLDGDDADNHLRGLGGNDTIHGRGGNDTIHGNGGGDYLFGDAGDDRIFGDGGADRIRGGGGADHIFGGAGIDRIFGGDGGDELRGGAGADVIAGDGGDDQIWGDGGNDRLGGGDGDDTIHGGAGHDVLFGDGGDNRLFGDQGGDWFGLSPDLAGSSEVLDFNYEAGDRIHLDVDTNGDGRLNDAEYAAWKAANIALNPIVEAGDTIYALPAAAGSALAPAAAGAAATVRLAGVAYGGGEARGAIYDYGVNANQEQQVPTNPSRSSDELEATLSPALNHNGRFLAVVSQFDLDPTAPPNPNHIVNAFVVDQLTDRAVRVNIGLDGGAADLGSSHEVAISGDGRFVAFHNSITDPQTDGRSEDVFVRDTLTGQIRTVAQGLPANEASLSLELSADGRTVALVSDGHAYVSTPALGLVEITVPTDAVDLSLSADGHHAVVGTTTNQLYVAEIGNSGPDVHFLHDGAHPDLSANGHFVVYDDLTSHQVVRQEMGGTGLDVVGGRTDDLAFLGAASVSDNGRFVAFASNLENLVPNDTNGLADIFVKDLQNGRIARVSIDERGEQAFGGSSENPSISGDGHFVAYVSGAPNLQNLFVDAPPAFQDELGGRTVVWSPVDFDRIAMPDVRGDAADTHAELQVGGTFQSDIAAFGDVDFARVSLHADQLYELTPGGSAHNGSPFIALTDGTPFAVAVSDPTNETFRYWSDRKSGIVCRGRKQPGVH